MAQALILPESAVLSGSGWNTCIDSEAKKEFVLHFETKMGGPGNGGISGDPLDFVLSHDGD